MTTVQEQYTEFVRQSQDAMLAAVDSWTSTVQDAIGKLPGVPGAAGPDQVIDQVFDFATKMLEVQRDFAKNIVKTSASVTEAVTRKTAASAERTADQV